MLNLYYTEILRKRPGDIHVANGQVNHIDEGIKLAEPAGSIFQASVISRDNKRVRLRAATSQTERVI